MGFPVAAPWHPWLYKNGTQVAGYAIRYAANNFTFLTVKGGRHEVPETAPEQALELLTKGSGLSGDQVATALRAATTRQLRSIVQDEGLLRDRRFATQRSLLEAAPDLLDVLRACAAAGSGVAYKARGETPVDEILLEHHIKRPR